jgi:hypothetical protein
VICVDASSEETIEQSYKAFAMTKHIGKTMDEAFQWLISSQRRDWLVILDGADVSGVEIRNFLPSCPHGNILITTRRNDLPSLPEWPRSETRVSKLDSEDALNLMLKVVGTLQVCSSSDEPDATRIVEVL